MTRYSVRVGLRENGVRVERTVSVDAKSPSVARTMALISCGREVVVLSVTPELYFEHRQHKYFWTAERQGDGTFAAVEFTPIGRGARSGSATRWKPAREARFPTRKAAEDCALEWYEAAKAKDTAATPADEQERQATLRSRAAFALLDPSLGVCKNCGGQVHVAEPGDERVAVGSGEDDESRGGCPLICVWYAAAGRHSQCPSVATYDRRARRVPAAGL